MLAGLVQKEMLIPDGYGRGMTYKINESYGVTQGKKVKFKILTQIKAPCVSSNSDTWSFYINLIALIFLQYMNSS